MAARPNIVVIMTDQQRADLSKREGFSLDTTPYMDSLARRGVWFDHAYTTMPICCSARISMLTGRYPSATRVRTNWNIPDACFTQDLFDVLRGAGYATALVGKNHSHLSAEKVDHWYECGHLGIHRDDLSDEEKAFNKFMEDTHFHVSTNPTPFPLECQIPYRLVGDAEKWVESVGERPFLLWLSFPEPHNPYQAPEPYYSMFPPEELPEPGTNADALETKGFKFKWCRDRFVDAFPGYEGHIQRARANYMGMLRLLDDQVKRFVESLERMRVLDDTIVVILSDHGDFVGEYGLLRKGPEVPEPLVRIPMQFAGRGVKPLDGPRGAHVSIADVMPTLCEAAGIDVPSGVQGRSLWPMLTGQECREDEFSSAYVEHGFGGLHCTGEEDLDPEQDGLKKARDGEWGAFDCLNSWTQSGTMRMVRKGDWKLVYDMDGAGQLYNLAVDPSEMNNRYGDPAVSAKQMELLEELLKWRLKLEDPLPLPRRRYVMKTTRGKKA